MILSPNLIPLRKDDITYHAAEVDGMYYMALRNRGVCKIYPQSYEPNASCATLNINLEGGIYDLTQAEQFGPLDATASALRTWARTVYHRRQFLGSGLDASHRIISARSWPTIRTWRIPPARPLRSVSGKPLSVMRSN